MRWIKALLIRQVGCRALLGGSTSGSSRLRLGGLDAPTLMVGGTGNHQQAAIRFSENGPDGQLHRLLLAVITGEVHGTRLPRSWVAHLQAGEGVRLANDVYLQ